MCGCWVDVCTTSWPSRLSHCATTPRPFERAHDLARGAQLARHRHGGLGLDGLEVDVDGAGEEQVVAPVLVHQRRARLRRAASMSLRHRQRIEVELDLGGNVFRLGARRRHAHGDQLADVAHLAGRQHRLHRRLEARQRGVGADRRHAGQVLGDEHALAQRRRNADALDARMRQRAAQERHLQHAGQPDVADILPAPAHVAVVFLAQQPRADALSATQPPTHARSPAPCQLILLLAQVAAGHPAQEEAPRDAPGVSHIPLP